MRLYHATSSLDVTYQIVAEGFCGNDVWELKNVVFLASRPLRGFGGWRESWVAVDVPDAELPRGHYPEKEWDDGQYRAECFAFPADFINQFPREAVERVQEND